MDLNLYNYDVIYFDVDGVILDSNKIKTEGFYTVAKKYGKEAAQKLVDYHTANGGISRYKKFDYLFTHILNQTDFESEKKKCLEQYSEVVRGQLLKAPMVHGLEQKLENEFSGISKFVITGGDEKEGEEAKPEVKPEVKEDDERPRLKRRRGPGPF